MRKLQALKYLVMFLKCSLIIQQAYNANTTRLSAALGNKDKFQLKK